MATAWKKTLRPWLSTLEDLQLRHTFSTSFTADGEPVRESWLCFDAPARESNSAKTWTSMREAMELLELLTRVDPRAAWRILTSVAYCDKHADDITLLPRFMVSFERDRDIENDVTSRELPRLLTDDAYTPSAAFTRVKQSLLSQWASQHDGRAFNRDVEGRIIISLEMTHAFYGDSDVFGLLQTLARANKRAVGAFIIGSLQIRMPRLDSDPGDDNKFRQLKEIEAAGLRISDMYFASLHHGELDPAVFGAFALEVFTPFQANGAVRGVANLQIEAIAFDAAGIRALCSAIARSTSLRCVNFEAYDDIYDRYGAQSATWWPWIMYALFSSSSDHGIKYVSLNVRSLTTSHVRAIQDVLHHENPLELLYEVTDASTQSLGQGEILMATLFPSTRVTVGRPSTTAGSGTEELKTLHIPDEAIACQVLRDHLEKGVLELFVPGVGVCWVDRTQVKELTAQVKRLNHPVRELSLQCLPLEGEAAQPVADLLRMVGGSLERLHLVGEDTLVDDHFCRSILPACASLDYLGLHQVQLESVQWLAEVPATCRLGKLDLTLTNATPSFKSSWLAFFSALSDPDHPLTRSLRELRIDVSELAYKGAESLAEAFVICVDCNDMLAKNHLLERCELLTSSKRLTATFKAHISAHDGKPIAQQKEPVPLRQKLAFLSVIARVQATEDQSAEQIKKKKTALTAGTLTEDITRLIFAYAAVPKRRVCRMS